jgi:hypothetical protein
MARKNDFPRAPKSYKVVYKKTGNQNTCCVLYKNEKV